MSTRKERGKIQRLYLIDKNLVNYTNCEFKVMGTTGNVYTVNMTNKPKCDCYDYKTRDRRCKHIYFILLRVMGLDEIGVDIEEYCDNELTVMFTTMKDPLNNVIIDSNIKNKYKTKKINKPVNMRKLDECPICLEDIGNKSVIHCESTCGNPVHKSCFDMWRKSKGNQCVFCRGEMIIQNEYVNLLQ